jgi:hypothetical protein
MPKATIHSTSTPSILDKINISRRHLMEGAVTAATVVALPVAASAASAASPDPLVALVDRWLPLNAAFRKADKELEDASDKQEHLGHFRYATYQYGSQRQRAFVYNDDVSAIEAYYAKCVDQAETPAQRTFLRQRCERQVKEARQYWEDWDRLHRELGLYDLEEKRRSAEAALGDIEDRIIGSVPVTMEGVAALIRYAITCELDPYLDEDDQPYSVRALRSALAFFGHEGGVA